MTMRTALDAPAAALDASERDFVAAIREQGWFRTEVSGDGDGPGFSFTTGFWATARRPELILFSLSGGVAHDIFRDHFDNARAGKALPVGRRTDELFGNAPGYAFAIARRHYREYLGWSVWFHGGRDDFPCHQIVWPDRAGLFPWEQGFDPSFSGSQPDLTERGWLAALAD